MNIILILGIDNFSRKNIPQVEYFNKIGYVFDVFTTDRLKDSKRNLPGGNDLFILEPSFFKRILQIYRYLKKRSNCIKHVEAYPGGRFSMFYVLFSKLFKLKMITVERGDLLYLNRYPLITKLSMILCYKFSDVVWYKEFYMKKILDKLKVKNTFFLHNSIKNTSYNTNYLDKRVEFLWVNRIIPERKISWFTDILKENKFKDTKNLLLGFQDILENEQRRSSSKVLSLNNLKVCGYIEPEDSYLSSKYFVLPSDIVFCNNSLLEAMSHGVVPLVSDVEGARLIVEDGVSGIVFEHNKRAFQSAMEKALNISKEQYEIMAKNAVEKVRKDFSYKKWGEKLLAKYKELEKEEVWP